MPEIDRGVIEELSRFFAPAYVREEVERLRGWQQQLQLDTSFGRVISSPTWISGVSIQNNTIDAQKLNVGYLRAITANTGSLVVSGSGEDPSAGQIAIAANPNNLLVSSIVMRATPTPNHIAGIRFRNASGAATMEFRLDGSAQIGAGATALTVSTTGVVSIPAGAIAGGLTITNVSSGTIGGDYEISNQTNQGSGYDRIRLDRTRGIGIFKAGSVEDTNWNNAVAAIRRDGSAKFTGGIEIRSTAGNLEFRINTTDGFLLRDTVAGINVFSVSTTGVARFRRGVFGETGTPGSGARIEILDTGIEGYGASGPTFRLGTDGSGFIRPGNSSDNAIAWSNESVTINASSITAGTITADRISGGTLGGSFATGPNAIDGSNASGGFKATSDDSATFRNGKLTIVAVNPNVRIVGSIYSYIGGLYISAVSSVSTTYSYISLKGGGTLDNPSWSGPELYLKYDSAAQNWATLQTGSMKLYCGAQGNGSEGSFFITLPDTNGVSKLQISRPGLTLLALASDGSLYYRGSTTTAGPGTYKGAILATVQIGGVDTTVKIPCYE